MARNMEAFISSLINMACHHKSLIIIGLVRSQDIHTRLFSSSGSNTQILYYFFITGNWMSDKFGFWTEIKLGIKTTFGTSLKYSWVSKRVSSPEYLRQYWCCNISHNTKFGCDWKSYFSYWFKFVIIFPRKRWTSFGHILILECLTMLPVPKQLFAG